MKTTVKKWGINGEGIAFHEGKPVFIENAIPDELFGPLELDEFRKNRGRRFQKDYHI